MGCGSSSEGGRGKKGKQRAGGGQPDIQLQSVQGRPPIRMVPKPERDQTGQMVQHQSYDLTKDVLQTALGIVAGYISQRNREVTIITVGGAVNTLLLQTRDSTHDVDFFTLNPDSSELSLIDQAQREAQARSPVSLGGQWINNSTILMIPKELRRQLIQQALDQNDVVFQSAGLRVLAAPWDYALCTKLDRMCKPHKREYDAADAAAYLRRYQQRYNVRGVRVVTLNAWANRFQTLISDPALRELEATYLEMYGGASPLAW